MIICSWLGSMGCGLGGGMGGKIGYGKGEGVGMRGEGGLEMVMEEFGRGVEYNLGTRTFVLNKKEL
ncbi:thiamine pyrophosphate-dependent enzyme [Staphylococcus epidermidis]|uniref:thiamine pyrophosphate-dependent enzyme n=1 Tax=Staphylococcus epidermidis TaxID=1282 RepID=UPI0021B40183|nr:thiamine pyrophosphate-dependent enzyme [Staphylococcus epidermidis]